MGKNRYFILITFLIALGSVILLSGATATQTYGKNDPQEEVTPQVMDSRAPESSQPEELAAALSPLLQYQGRLTNPATGKAVANGEVAMSFRLYDVSTGGAALWTETKNVMVTDGLFSTMLGDTAVLSQSLFNGQALWLGVTVAADPEAMPRQQVLPVAYALSLVPGAVITSNSTTPAITGSSTGNGANFTTSSTSAGKAGILGVAGSASPAILYRESGVSGTTGDGFGVSGISTNNYGVIGFSSNSYGVRGESMSGNGVFGGSWGSPGYGGYFYSSAGTAIYASGSITATGNVSGQYTSLPLAYAHINSSGTLASGSANVSTVWNTNHYEITITGENYFYTNYVTTVTLGYGCGAGNSPRVASGGGKLWVYITTTTGSYVQCEFQFVSLKP